MKFDVVVGNPPYQEDNKDRNRDDAVYPYFYTLAEKLSDKYCLISPARFLFNIGSTSRIWNEKMLSDKHLKVLDYRQKSSDIFPNTDITAGIVTIYRDSQKEFEAIQTFTTFKELNSILQKVDKITPLNENIGNYMFVQTKYNLEELYSRYPDVKVKIGSGGKEKRLVSSTFETLSMLYYEKQKDENYVLIYGRVDNKRVYKWIDKALLEHTGNFSYYKVILPAANGSGAIGEGDGTSVIGIPVLGQPNTGYTQTFISIGCFDNEFEGKALLKYLKTKFCRTMLGIKKTTQNNKTQETWSKVPLLDYTPNSDIDWTRSIPEIDQQLYEKYGLSEQEIAFIEEKIKPME